MADPTTPHLHKSPRRWPLILIGLGKLLKSVGLVLIFFVLGALIAPDEHTKIIEALNSIRLEPHNWLIHDAIEKLFGIQEHTLKILHVGVIIYAALYLIEGLGLLWDKKWAEWMVILTTAGFLPFEIYEIYLEATPGRILLFLANIVVMIYLCWRLYRLHIVKVEHMGTGFPITPQNIAEAK